MHPTNGLEGMTVRLLIASVASLGFFAAIIFWPAGTIDWLEGWLYFGLFSTSALITYVYLQRVNPEVIEHRLRLKKGTKPWDKLWFVFFTPAFKRLGDDFLKTVVHSGYSQRPGGSLGKTLVFTHLKFTANPWPLLVNRTKHGVSVKGRTPAIIQPRHAPRAPFIYLDITIGHSGIGDE